MSKVKKHMKLFNPSHGYILKVLLHLSQVFRNIHFKSISYTIVEPFNTIEMVKPFNKMLKKEVECDLVQLDHTFFHEVGNNLNSILVKFYTMRSEA